MDAITSYGYRSPKFCVNKCRGSLNRGGTALLGKMLSFSKPRKVFNFHIPRLASEKLKPLCPAASLSPNPEAGSETNKKGIEEAHLSKTVHVRFQLKKRCQFGEKFLLVGSDPMLGSWDPCSAIPMNWSDGDLWTLDLDIPIGRKIWFKFILKGSPGIIHWQPDSDRVLKTWETDKTITVCEDWENAALQRITEQELLSDPSKELTDKSEMHIVAGILSPPMGEAIHETENGSALADIVAAPAEISLEESRDESSAVKTKPPLQNKPVSVVAENITLPGKKTSPDAADSIKTKEPIRSEEKYGGKNEVKTAVPESVLGDNLKDKASNSASPHNEGDLVTSKSAVAENITLPGEKTAPSTADSIKTKEPIRSEEKYGGQNLVKTAVPESVQGDNLKDRASNSASPHNEGDLVTSKSAVAENITLPGEKTAPSAADSIKTKEPIRSEEKYGGQNDVKTAVPESVQGDNLKDKASNSASPHNEGDLVTSKSVAAENITLPGEKTSPDAADSIQTKEPIRSEEKYGETNEVKMAVPESVLGDNLKDKAGNSASPRREVLEKEPSSTAPEKEPTQPESKTSNAADNITGSKTTDPQEPEAKEEQVPSSDQPLEEETVIALLNHEKRLSEMQKEAPPSDGGHEREAEEEGDEEKVDLAQVDDVLRNDIQWGRKTLRNFLANLGLSP